MDPEGSDKNRDKRPFCSAVEVSGLLYRVCNGESTCSITELPSEVAEFLNVFGVSDFRSFYGWRVRPPAKTTENEF
jgi:hypothetical protein